MTETLLTKNPILRTANQDRTTWTGNQTTGAGYVEFLDSAGASVTPATADNQALQTTALGNILTAVSSRYSFAETVFSDSAVPPLYWIRTVYQDPVTFLPVVVFNKPDGTAGTPTGIITPAATQNTFTDITEFDVIAAGGTGYSLSDIVTNAIIREVNGGAVLGDFWYNKTISAVIVPAYIVMDKLQRANETVNTKITDGTNTITIETAGTDATSNTQNNLTVTSRLKVFNGTTWDMVRSAQTSVSSTFTGFLSVLPWSVYKATPTTRTDGQGGALLSDPNGNLSVGATPRVCVSHQGITVPITTGVTLASLCSGGVIPVGAVTCEIQALDAVVRYRLDASTVTPTTGMRLNVDDKLVIDSALASVRLVAQSGVAACSVAFFDRV